jgi:hypothetical protein
MVAAIPRQPQAAAALAVGAVGLGLVAGIYAFAAALTASGRRDLDRLDDAAHLDRPGIATPPDAA